MTRQGERPPDGDLTAVPPMDDAPAALVSLSDLRTQRQEARRLEAVSLRLAGVPVEAIAERLEIDSESVTDLIDRTLLRHEPEIDALRRLENARLDRAQSAIWTRVLEGDVKAVDSYLRIAQRRARLNGLDAATKIDLGITVRQEMEQALIELERVVLGEVIRDVSGPDDEWRPALDS